ncbi:MAG TPA: TIGR02611 family protein [Jatrophihabitans sp.]|nr:TIGR02611 family protein [Jatrophihabitans sp.]
MTRSEAPPRREGVVGRVEAFRARVRALPGGRTAWRAAVTALGVLIIAGGIILLPLPGPGWLIIFAGLGLLATEYEWAHRLLTFAKQKVQSWWHWIGRQPMWVRAAVGLLTALLVGAIVALAVWLYL